MNLIQELEQQKLITPPYWLPANIGYLVIGGSESYGYSIDTSDKDIFGFCLPPRHVLFPWENGIIPGYGTQQVVFNDYENHHVKDERSQKQYDIKIYNIVKFAELLRQGNPNILDILFVPDNCILHITKSGIHLRNNRKLFLSKASVNKFVGFAWSHFKSMGTTKKEGKRAELVAKFGYDVKDLACCFRIVSCLENILVTGDHNIQLCKDQCKAIRRGEWTLDQGKNWFGEKLESIEKAKHNSPLPDQVDELATKKVLIECLELHYGRLDSVIHTPERSKQMLREIAKIISEGHGAF